MRAEQPPGLTSGLLDQFFKNWNLRDAETTATCHEASMKSLWRVRTGHPPWAVPETRLNREAVVREMADGGDVERGAEAGDPVLTAWVPVRVWKWKSLSRVRLCESVDYTVHGILQARTLEWVAFPFSRGSGFFTS